MGATVGRKVRSDDQASAALSDETLGRLIRSVHRAFVRALEAGLAGSGITGGEWSCLRVLWQGDGVTQVELARAMGVEKASLTPVLASLERKRLVRRVRNEQDRRKLNLHLSDGGWALREQLMPVAIAVNKRAERGLSRAELARTREVLDQLIQNLTVA